MTFTLTIQDPFEQQEQVHHAVTAAVAYSVFDKINWAAIKEDLYLRQDEVVHYFYFYEICAEDYNEKRTLNISPDFSEAKNAEDSPFTLHYTWPDAAQPGKTLDCTKEQCTYDYARQCLQALINEDHNFLLAVFEAPGNERPARGGCLKKMFFLFLLCTIVSLAFIHFLIGWNHVPHHIASLKMVLFPGEEAEAAGTTIAAGTEADTVSVTIMDPKPEVLCDTLFWKKQIEQGKYIPEGVKDAYERTLKFDYTTLQLTADKPDNKEAEAAIVKHYKDAVKQLLQENKAHIRIGKAYKASLQNDGARGKEIARVTAMVCAFDEQGKNLGNISLPLYIAYDFVQYASDPGTWYITDISQTIPYDYELNKNK